MNDLGFGLGFSSGTTYTCIPDARALKMRHSVNRALDLWGHQQRRNYSRRDILLAKALVRKKLTRHIHSCSKGEKRVLYSWRTGDAHPQLRGKYRVAFQMLKDISSTHAELHGEESSCCCLNPRYEFRAQVIW